MQYKLSIDRRDKWFMVEILKSSPNRIFMGIDDSTVLRSHRDCVWRRKNQGAKNVGRTWCKSHVGYDPFSGGGAASLLTTEHTEGENALKKRTSGTNTSVFYVFVGESCDGTSMLSFLTTAFEFDLEIVFLPLVAIVADLNERCSASIRQASANIWRASLDRPQKPSARRVPKLQSNNGRTRRISLGKGKLAFSNILHVINHAPS